MSDAVLIAAPDRVPALAAGELRDAVAFADSDALAAFQAIADHRPRVVALDQPFAESARGAALILRIKADPSLHACEVRIVGLDAPSAVPAAPASPPAALDRHGTRAAPRYTMEAGARVTLDGNAVVLVDLSVGGAQVVGRTTLRPNQRVRMALRDGERPIRVGALVKWARVEMQSDGPHFRAGLALLEPDGDALAAYIDAHRAGRAAPRPADAASPQE